MFNDRDDKGLVFFKDGRTESILEHEDLGEGRVYMRTRRGEYIYSPELEDPSKYAFYDKDNLTVISEIAKVELVL